MKDINEDIAYYKWCAKVWQVIAVIEMFLVAVAVITLK